MESIRGSWRCSENKWAGAGGGERKDYPKLPVIKTLAKFCVSQMIMKLSESGERQVKWGGGGVENCLKPIKMWAQSCVSKRILGAFRMCVAISIF